MIFKASIKFTFDSFRYCCQNMWGEAVAVTSISQVKSNESVKYTETDVIVDAPFIKTLFDGCEWKDFKSVR